MEGMAVLRAAQGIPDYDVNRDATHQEMRSYVCGQCHVEYYFKGDQKRLTYPWHKGLLVEQMLAYYDEVGFADWTHQDSGARVLKAQHPEFEVYNQGVHARAGVSCADCHMPYRREGALKISDHQVRSPLLNINRACQTCHRWEEAELRARVHTIQERTYLLRNNALAAVVDLIDDIAAAVERGVPEAQLTAARHLQRHAQFMTDFVEAENSMGFHAPQEVARIIAYATDLARQGQVAIRDPEFKPRFPAVPPAAASSVPDVKSRSAARAGASSGVGPLAPR
jgi:nitrite reductase (cytochrome c-552)